MNPCLYWLLSARYYVNSTIVSLGIFSNNGQDAPIDWASWERKEMNPIKSLLLVFILLGTVWAAEPADSPPTGGPEVTLNAAAHYVDSILANTLASLELIASTPEAKSGDWNGIKRYLKQVEAGLPGAYFFFLPDGNYYSVALDYTNLNVSDRAYFKSLFAGKQVKGVPIYSRSSGKKSALMAAPIVVENKVVGGVGASVFLDELNAKLDSDFAMPPGYSWYVLNSDGLTMLNKNSDFIFMNALTQGSQSLKAAVSTALKHESGAMEYELGGIRHAQYRKLPNMDWWLVMTRINGQEAEAPPKLTLSLDRFVRDLQSRLNQIDASLANSIEGSRTNILQKGEIRKLLAALYDKNPDVLDASYVDDKGILREIEPGDYKNLENTDISPRENVQAMLKTHKPVFSSGFKAIEGFVAVDLARPLFDPRNNFLGSVSAFLRPELLIAPLLKKSVVPADYELWIMQPDGMIIFDQDKEEIGRMLFSDPLYAGYTSLLDLGRKIAAEPAGKGSYIFLAPGSEKKVIKNVAWQSVRLHDREWRVVLAYRPYE